MAFAQRIRQFEALTHSRKFAAALELLLEFLNDLGTDGGELAQWCTFDTDEARVRRVFTRLANGVCAMLGSQDFDLTRADYDRLMPHMTNLAQILCVSELATADHVLSQIETRSARQQEGRIMFRNASDARKFILGCSLYSRYGDMLIRFARHDPKAMHAPLLAAMSPDLTGEPAALERRHRMLDAISALTAVTPRSDIMGRLARVWAQCSYATVPNKHEAKVHLNRMIRNWLDAEGIRSKVQADRSKRKGKPTLLVACEVGKTEHVMYRCYVYFLRQLRQRFRVVAFMSDGGQTSPDSSWCDDIVTFHGANVIMSDVVRTVVEQKPHAIYYPSLGMGLWAVLLCNLRLAPLQFASLGHPATTRSPEIDAMVMGKDMLGSADCFSERIVLLDCPGNFFAPRASIHDVDPVIRDHPDPLKIAINASIMKLNADFLQLCRRITRKAGRRLEFHFFPNTIGLRHVVTRVQMQKSLPDSTVHVHTRAEVGDYLRNLNACDVCLSPFPFGGENSTLDGLLQGLPVVTLEGLEPHARLDSRVMRLVGAPSWLITHDESEYEQAALRLIDDDDIRSDVSRALTAIDVRAVVEQEHEQYTNDFVDTIWWMYENQERIKAGGKRVWRRDEDPQA